MGLSLNGWGCGGIIRDYKGNILFPFSLPLIRFSIIFIELKAVNISLDFYLQKGLFNIWIDVEALILLIQLKKSNVGLYHLLHSTKCMLL